MDDTLRDTGRPDNSEQLHSIPPTRPPNSAPTRAPSPSVEVKPKRKRRNPQRDGLSTATLLAIAQSSLARLSDGKPAVRAVFVMRVAGGVRIDLLGADFCAACQRLTPMGERCAFEDCNEPLDTIDNLA